MLYQNNCFIWTRISYICIILIIIDQTYIVSAYKLTASCHHCHKLNKSRIRYNTANKNVTIIINIIRYHEFRADANRMDDCCLITKTIDDFNPIINI